MQPEINKEINTNHNSNSRSSTRWQHRTPPSSPIQLEDRDDISSPMSTSVAPSTTPSTPTTTNVHENVPLTAFTPTKSPSPQDGPWPCANCHAMVSESVCPFCHGIQVKIKNEETVRTLAAQAWIERVSPTTTRGGGTPLSTSSFPPSTGLMMKRAQNSNSSAQRVIFGDHTNELVELNEEDEEEELEQNSSTSSSSPRQSNDDAIEAELEDESAMRPDNPVALLLATTASAESPLTTHNKLELGDEATLFTSRSYHHREDLKKQSKERVEDGASTDGKKQRILFAM